MALAALWPLLASPATAAELQPYEYGAAGREVARVRILSQRISKENLLYQLHIGEKTKDHLIETAAEIDRALELLGEGSAAYGVPAPPSPEIRAQLARVAERWDPVRTMALASPYDYLRRSQEYVPRESRMGDPLLIRRFDELSLALAAEAGRLMQAYADHCTAAGVANCQAGTLRGRPATLAERMAKELVLVYAGLDVEKNEKRLAETRAAFAVILEEVRTNPFVARIIADPDDPQAAFVRELIAGIETDWERLRIDVDLALEGRAGDIQLRRVLRIDEHLVDEMDRLAVAVERINTTRRAAAAR